MATWCKELTHCKRLWCWERLRAGGEGDNRGWDGWMASLTQWTWVWVDSGSWWWTGRPGVLRFMGLQRVGHDWATELNWNWILSHLISVNSLSFSLFRKPKFYLLLWIFSFWKHIFMLSPHFPPDSSFIQFVCSFAKNGKISSRKLTVFILFSLSPLHLL